MRADVEGAGGVAAGFCLSAGRVAEAEAAAGAASVCAPFLLRAMARRGEGQNGGERVCSSRPAAPSSGPLARARPEKARLVAPAAARPCLSSPAPASARQRPPPPASPAPHTALQLPHAALPSTPSPSPPHIAASAPPARATELSRRQLSTPIKPYRRRLAFPAQLACIEGVASCKNNPPRPPSSHAHRCCLSRSMRARPRQRHTSDGRDTMPARRLDMASSAAASPPPLHLSARAPSCDRSALLPMLERSVLTHIYPAGLQTVPAQRPRPSAQDTKGYQWRPSGKNAHAAQFYALSRPKSPAARLPAA